MRCLWLMVCILAGVGPTAAEVLPQMGRGEIPALRLPDFEPPPRQRGSVLPPVVLEQTDDALQAGSETVVFVQEVQVQGTTRLSPEELEALVAPYEGRELSFEQIRSLRDAITRAYVQRGYVSSGAVLPSQSVQNGRLQIDVVEGKMTKVHVRTDGRFRAGYVRQRLDLGDGPVNVFELEKGLQRLQRDPRIERIDARLIPGEIRGEAELEVTLEEGSPVRVLVDANNYRPPAMGSYQGQAMLQLPNVTGWGDGFWASFSGSEGAREVDAAYEIPVTRWDTALEVHFRWNDGDVIESPFEGLDIKSNSYTIGGGLNQPLYRDQRRELSAFLLLDWRRSKSYLLGQGWSFSPGAIDGVSKVLVLRAGLSAAYRTSDQVFAVRSILSRGFDAPGTTNQGPGIPDGDFLAWLAQAQYAYRFPWFGLEFLARADLQLASQPLLPLEQFAMGGHGTVNGYRENAVVRDNGVVGSIALRRFFDLPTRYLDFLALGPFFDVGHGWNRKRAGANQRRSETIYSVGASIQLHALDHLDIMVSYGHALTSRPREPDWDLQDSGVQFNVVLSFP